MPMALANSGMVMLWFVSTSFKIFPDVFPRPFFFSLFFRRIGFQISGPWEFKGKHGVKNVDFGTIFPFQHFMRPSVPIGGYPTLLSKSLIKRQYLKKIFGPCSQQCPSEDFFSRINWVFMISICRGFSITISGLPLYILDFSLSPEWFYGDSIFSGLRWKSIAKLFSKMVRLIYRVKFRWKFRKACFS